MAIPADLSSEAECRRLADAFGGREHRLHILVNNAGTNWFAPIAEHDDKAWDRVLSLNLKGLFHLTRFLLPLIQASATDEDPARIINVGSVEGLKPGHYETYAYAPSKAGVHLLTRHLARDLAPRFTVNAIAPGPFPTKMISATPSRPSSCPPPPSAAGAPRRTWRGRPSSSPRGPGRSSPGPSSPSTAARPRSAHSDRAGGAGRLGAGHPGPAAAWWSRQGDTMDLPYQMWDADNHLYETTDAFTRHLPEPPRRDLFWVTDERGHQHIP